MANSSIIADGFTQISNAPVPLWIKVLALFGAIYLFNTVLNTGVSLVKLGAYLIGFLRFVYMRFKK